MKYRLSIPTLVLILAAGCDRATLPTATPDAPSGLSPAAAAPTPILEATWGGPGSDVTEAAAVAADGGTYLAGFTSSFGGGASKVFLVKFAADGSLAWQRTWDAPASAFTFFNDEARDVAVSSDGSVYVAGSSFVGGNGALLLKFGADGTIVWQRIFGGNGRADAVAVAGDGSVYVTGSTRASDGSDDLFVARFSPDGTPIWFKTWGAPNGTEQGQGIAVGPDGNITVAGVAPRAGDPFGGQFDAIALKVDPAGTLIWQRAFAGGDVTDARGGVALAPDGSAYVAGGFQGPGGGNAFVNDALLLKIAGDGTLTWARTWGGKSGDFAEDVAIAPDGSVLFVGGTDSYGQGGGNDAFYLRVSPSGRATEALTWGSATLDFARGVGVAPDGTVSLGATTDSPPPYVLDDAAARTSRARLTVSTPTMALIDAVSGAADPAGVVETPPGSTTYSGSFEAALVRLAP